MVHNRILEEDAWLPFKLQAEADVDIFAITEKAFVKAADTQEKFPVIHCRSAAWTEAEARIG
jgi:hypothetical protein